MSSIDPRASHGDSLPFSCGIYAQGKVCVHGCYTGGCSPCYIVEKKKLNQSSKFISSNSSNNSSMSI